MAATVASCALGGLFLLAGGMKINAPASFVAVVTYLLPESLHGSARELSTAVVGWEALLGVGLVLAWKDRRVLACAAVTILLFAGVLLKLGLTPGAPSCSCFGPLDAAERAGVGLWSGLARNAGMLAAIAWLWTVASPAGRSVRLGSGNREAGVGLGGAGGVGVERAAASKGRPSGFTLVELLICIAIVALLLALALPSLRHVRHDALYAVSASTQRQLLAGLETYSGEAGGLLPYLATPGQPFAPIRVLGRSLHHQGYFADQSAFWSLTVNADHVGLPDEALACPPMLLPVRQGSQHDSRGLLMVPRFAMTHTAFADADFWTERATGELRADLRRLRPQRRDSIAHPSSKGLTIDIALGFHNPRGDWAYRTVSMVGWSDGSCSTIDMLRAATQGDGLYVREPGLGAQGMPVWGTRSGLLGRDR